MFSSFELMALPQTGSASDPIDLEASAHGLPLSANTTALMGAKVGGNSFGLGCGFGVRGL
jgi:hypothetical protein